MRSGWLTTGAARRVATALVASALIWLGVFWAIG